ASIVTATATRRALRRATRAGSWGWWRRLASVRRSARRRRVQESVDCRGAQSSRVTLALERQRDHFAGDDRRPQVVAIVEPQPAQGVVEPHADGFEVIRAERRLWYEGNW